MSVSSNSLMSSLMLQPEVTQDNLIGAQLGTADETIEGMPALQDQALNETEFWSLLNQTLHQIVADEDPQVIENKELLSVFNEFEVELQQAEMSQDLPDKWMQVLKSHFELSEMEVTEDRPETLEQIQPEQTDLVETSMQPMLSAALSVNTQSDENTSKMPGESLPPLRQVASVEVKPELSVRQAEITDEQSKLTNKTDLPVDKNWLDNNLPVESKPEVTQVADKIISKSIAAEQLPQVIKETVNSLQQSTSQVVMQPVQALSTTPIQQNLPTQLHTLQLAPQAQTAEWGNAVGERISFLINHKVNHAEIRIDPPHLGKMDIQIQVKDDSAMIVINTQTAQARDLIDSASVRLREFLHEAGYSSVDVNVSHREQSMAQHDSGQPGQEISSEVSQNDSAGEIMNEGLSMHAASISINDGRIDYFA